MLNPDTSTTILRKGIGVDRFSKLQQSNEWFLCFHDHHVRTCKPKSWRCQKPTLNNTILFTLI